jgi:hypothetical protein
MRALAALVLAFLLGGCVVPTREPAAPPVAAPAEFPEAYYQEAQTRGIPVYRVDPEQSLVVIEVGRTGTLARLGHDHVVASRNVMGYVSPDERRADLYIVLAELVVDEAPLRAEAEMTSQPSAADIEGTRANMLNKVLQADEFPYALVRVTGIAGAPGSEILQLSIALHGTTQEIEVPAQIEMDRDSIVARGHFSFDVSAFGITPFSVMGGALAVRDRVDLQFDVRAERVRGPALPGDK